MALLTNRNLTAFLAGGTGSTSGTTATTTGTSANYSSPYLAGSGGYTFGDQYTSPATVTYGTG